jgi:ABC-type transport system substrate-binding protein
VEWLYGSPSDAVDALRKGLVDAVDRVPPGDVADLRMDPDIEVRSYLVPTVHMLVPNIRNDFTKAPTFRSALLKGINREEILMTMCDKKRIDGMEVINGPFPIGSDENPQIAYAYNSRVAPVQFSRMIGRVLVEVVRQTLEGKMIQKGEIVQAEGDVPFKLEIPELVLAHPKGDVPSIACTAISRMWNQLGIKTRLVELPPGVTIPDNDDYDFLYVELTMTEPLADADFLFGSQGVVNDLSAPIEQMMRQVNVSNSWRAASNNLKQLHRQILNDVAVLPLWQMREHYAHRRNVRDVGRDLMFLYQYVDRWQIGALNEKSK